MAKKVNISGWGKYPVVKALCHYPEDLIGVQALIKQESKLTINGQLRSYGDAAVGDITLSSQKLKKILSWDKNKGEIECQSGVTLESVINKCLSDGYFLAVTPGTKFITVGGAVASDVHGKNHHKDGTFSKFVVSFLLINEVGELKNCSREENVDLFYETIGGMGQTGFIFSVKFRLQKIATAYIKQKTIIKNSWQELLIALEENKDYTYSVAWIDIQRKGRGVLYLGEHAEEEDLSGKQLKNKLKLGGNSLLKFPKWMPGIFINNLTIHIFNALYFFMNRSKKDSVIHYDGYFYPLDALLGWNHIYGKKGFIQYQFVVGHDVSEECMEVFLEVLKKYKQYAFVTVLKQFGEKYSEAFNSFPRKGITLTVDLKVSHKTKGLVKELDEIILKYEGQVYRSKDALSNATLMPVKFNNKNDKFGSKQTHRLG